MSQVKRIPWLQAFIALILIALMFVLGDYIDGFDRELPLQLFIGGLIGYALARGNFGFASFVRRPYTTGNGTVVKAFVKMMLLTMVVYLGIQWFAQSNGALPEYAANGGMLSPGRNISMTSISRSSSGLPSSGWA